MQVDMPRYEDEDEYGEDFGGIGQRLKERREDSRERDSSRGERAERRGERSDRARSKEKAREMTLGARTGRARPDESPKGPRKHPVGFYENRDQKLNWETMRGPSNERTQGLTDKAGVWKKDYHEWGYPYQRQYPPSESNDSQKDGKGNVRGKGKEKA